MSVLLEELARVLDESGYTLVVCARHGTADVEFDVWVERDALPLRALGLC